MQNAVVPPRRRRWSAALVVALAVALPACDSGPQTAASVVLDAPSTALFVGQTVQITATVKDGSGKTLLNRPILYQSSAPPIAAVSSTGEVVALSPGSATVSATVDAATGSLSIVVSPVPVSRIAMSRDTATVKAATTLQLTATPQDSAGHTLGDRALAWSSSDPTVATVNGAGLVSALAPGSATISASTEGKTGTTRLTVTPAAVASIDVTPSMSVIAEGNTKQLTATVKDAAGHVLTGRTLTWTSSDVTKATVDSTGLVFGVAQGPANILVTSGSVFGGASVLVTPLVVGSVTVSPDSATVQVGSTVQLTAVVKDSAANVVNRRVAWSSLDTSIATVDTTGLVRGVAFGTTRIVGAAGARADTVRISVVGQPVATVTLTPTSAQLGILREAQLLLTIRDDAGNPTSAPVEWFVSDSSVLSVDSTGVIKGLALGSAQVYAWANQHLGISNITVVGVPVDQVLVTADSTDISVGETTQLNIVVEDAGGASLSGRILSFRSLDPTYASVSPTGLVRALKSGTATIEVTSEEQKGTIDITIR